jgi:hypothetical protein
MKTLCPAILLAALCATAHADVDIDTARKLAAVDRQCLRQDDLVKVFQSAPVASASPVFPEPTLPYIPVRTYQFVFPATATVKCICAWFKPETASPPWI